VASQRGLIAFVYSIAMANNWRLTDAPLLICRVYRLCDLQNLYLLSQNDELFVVPPGDHFFWFVVHIICACASDVCLCAEGMVDTLEGRLAGVSLRMFCSYTHTAQLTIPDAISPDGTPITIEVWVLG
jgi:hypothetical protein